MMAFKQALILLASVCLVYGQRPSFAGSKPIGFPELVNKTSDPLGNRFGEDLPLPIEAKGDRDLVERISKMPIDQQPFWYINWKALEEQRKNPQTYEQRPNTFIDNQAQNSASNSGGLTSRFNTDTSNQMPSNNDNGFNQNSYQMPTYNGNGFDQNRQTYRRYNRF